ncbi:YVTN repeat-like/Quino protein amine dehydrogenase, partial [Pholiota conissans]
LVIIDALDEIDGEGGSEFLRDLLDSINKHRLRGLKFFATSRPNQDLVEHLQSFRNKQFYHLRQVPVKEADADITAYLNAELPRFRDTPEIKKLVEQAAGLFIYAATAVKYLSKLKFSLSEQMRRINRLLESGIPQSTKETPLLDNLYQQVLFDAVGQFMDDEDEDENMDFKHRLKILHTELKFNIANIQSSFLLDHDNAALPDAIKQNISLVLRYTCHNWVYHLSLADSNKLADTLTNFLRLPVLFWIEAMNLMGSRGLCEYMLRGARKVVMNVRWKTHFPGIPKFVHSAGGAALMTITTASPVCTIALSSNGKYLVSGLYDGTVQVRDASTGEELKVLKGHGNYVWSVAFSSDNKRIVSGSEDETVRVWDVSTGEELKVLEGH